MTLPCMRILARAGSSYPALYPLLLRANVLNGVQRGVYKNWASRATARYVTTLLHRAAPPNEEPDDFIPDLRDSIVEAIHKRGITIRRYIILQVTPSYSHLISDPDFLREIIDRAVKTAGYKIGRVEAAGVVIDNIPQNKHAPIAEGWSLFVTDRQMRFYADTSAAYQRFQYVSVPTAHTPIIPPPDFRISRNPDNDRGTLQLAFQTVNTDNTPDNNNKTLLSRARERLYIKTKLANTLFQTGMPATAMIHMYRVDGEDDGSNVRLFPELVRYTKDLTIRFNGAQVWEARLNYRLRRLTAPRRISESLGNIVKKVKIGKLQEIPASQELEAAIARLTVKRPTYDPITLEKHPIEVFARISQASSKEVGQRIPEKGVRYVKVLAGGGGWGENAGILALDPETLEGYKPPKGLEGYLKEIGDSGPTSIQGKYITFFTNDPIKSSARGRKRVSEGQWLFTNTTKGHTLRAAETAPEQTPIENPATNQPSDSASGAVDEAAADSTKEVATEPTEEVVAKPTEKTARDPTEEATAESTEEATPKSAEEVIADPTKEVATDPTNETAAESTEETTTRPGEEAATEPTVEAIVSPIEKAAIELTENAAIEPTEETIKKSTEEVAIGSAKEVAIEPVEEVLANPSEKAAINTTEETTPQPTKETTTKLTEEAAVSSAQEIVTKPTEKAATDPTEEAVIKSSEEVATKSTEEPAAEPKETAINFTKETTTESSKKVDTEPTEEAAAEPEKAATESSDKINAEPTEKTAAESEATVKPPIEEAVTELSEKTAVNSEEATTESSDKIDTESTQEVAAESGKTAPESEATATELTEKAATESSDKKNTESTEAITVESEVATAESGKAAVEVTEEVATESSEKPDTKSTDEVAAKSKEVAAESREATAEPKEANSESKEAAVEPTEKATTDSAEEAPSKDSETNTTASESKQQRQPKKPPQALQTGTETGIWVNGNKIDIPQFSILLDLLEEVGEFHEDAPPRVRFVGMKKKDLKPIKIDKSKESKRPYISLSLMNKKYNLEGEKYDEEIQKARQDVMEDDYEDEYEDENEYEDTAVEAEGSNSIIGTGPLWVSKPLEGGRKSGEELEVGSDMDLTARELEELYKKQGQAVEVKFIGTVPAKKTKQEGTQKDDVVPPQLTPSEPSGQPDGSDIDREIEKQGDSGLESNKKEEQPVEEETVKPDTVAQEIKEAGKKDDEAPAKEV